MEITEFSEDLRKIMTWHLHPSLVLILQLKNVDMYKILIVLRGLYSGSCITLSVFLGILRFV
jgi:hypothetical protein